MTTGVLLVSPPRPIYNPNPLMSSRAIAAVLSIGLLILIGPTPFPVQFADQLQAARTALDAGRYELALPWLEQALAREPDLPELSLELIEVALRAQQPQLAEALIRRLPQSVSDAPRVDCYRARAAVQLADWRRAIRAADLADPRCTEPLAGLRQLAAGMTESGEYESAYNLLSELAELDPASGQTQLSLGLLEAVSRPAQAISRMTLALQLDPQLQSPADLVEIIEAGLEAADPAFTLAQVGQSLARAGEWRLAAEAFRAALELEPEYTEARAYYGLALDRSGRNGLAELEQAASEAPEAALPEQLLGKHWRAHDEPALALAAFEAAASLAPDDPLIAADLGTAYATVGDLPAARAAYIRAAELAPGDPVMWRLLAQFAVDFEVELPQLGIPAARRALALQPNSADALDLLGYGYYLNGDWELADRFLNRAVEADPQAASAHYHLGLLQISRGRAGAGRRALHLAWSLDPQGRVGNLALRSLENLP